MPKTPNKQTIHKLTVPLLRDIASKRRVTLRTIARKDEIIRMLETSIPPEQLRRDVKKRLKQHQRQKKK